MEALRVEIRRHQRAIGENGFGVELVENGIEVFCVACSFGGFGFVGQPLHVFRRKIVVGVAEHLLRGGDEFGIVGARAHEVGFARRRGHRIDVAVVAEAGMRVIVVERNFFDLRE